MDGGGNQQVRRNVRKPAAHPVEASCSKSGPRAGCTGWRRILTVARLSKNFLHRDRQVTDARLNPRGIR